MGVQAQSMRWAEKRRPSQDLKGQNQVKEPEGIVMMEIEQSSSPVTANNVRYL
jgi:hypothetical protein